MCYYILHMSGTFLLHISTVVFYLLVTIRSPSTLIQETREVVIVKRAIGHNSSNKAVLVR